MARWFRFYDEALDDPKVQRLPDALYRRWTDFLCVASRNGGRITGDVESLAFMIRQTPAKTKAAVSALVAAGLLDKDGDGYTPHGWRTRQYDSDSSAERMRRHRERRRDGDVTSHVTPSLRTSDAAEQNRTEQNRDVGVECARDPKREVLEAMGVWDDPRWLGNGGLVEAWIGSGADLDKDILPTVQRLMKSRGAQGPPASLKYFDRAVMDAHATRTTPVKAGKVNGSQAARPTRSDVVNAAVAAAFADVAGQPPPDR